jgi:hypothetical protein
VQATVIVLWPSMGCWKSPAPWLPKLRSVTLTLQLATTVAEAGSGLVEAVATAALHDGASAP